jgi:hypothetical protein
MSINSELTRLGVFRPGPKKFKIKNIITQSYKGKTYESYQEARSKVRKLHLNSSHQWKRHCYFQNLPSGVPENPELVYRNTGWSNYKDWLGIKTIKITKRKTRKSKRKKTKIIVKKDLDFSKNMRFKRLASKRVPKAINSIRLIGNLSNKSMYAYSQEDYKKILRNINKSINKLKKKYIN